MVEIICNNKNREAKEYIFNILFNTILGIEFTVAYEDVYNYRIQSQRTAIHIPDILLQSRQEDWFIDSKIDLLETKLAPEGNIPVMYGDDSIEVSRDNQFAEVTIGFDVFGAAFSVVTRLEEYFCNKTDNHHRFPEEESHLVKFNLIERCIVNEYAEFLWTCLKQSGESVQRAQRAFSFIATHDIDYALRWNSFADVLKSSIGDVLKRRSISKAATTLKSGLKALKNRSADPFHTYSFFMDEAEKYNLRSVFYFLCDSRNVPFLKSEEGKNVLKIIHERGHTVGLHPNFGTYKSVEQMNKEKLFLEQLTGIAITDSRQHYLQLNVKDFWEIFEVTGMQTDSSLYFSKHPGFRNGMCLPFPIFSLSQMKTTNIVEVPLTFMDASILLSGMSKEKAQDLIEKLMITAHRYAGCFVVLWHNNFNSPEWNGIGEELFKYTLKLYSDIVEGKDLNNFNRKNSGCCSKI